MGSRGTGRENVPNQRQFLRTRQSQHSCEMELEKTGRASAQAQHIPWDSWQQIQAHTATSLSSLSGWATAVSNQFQIERSTNESTNIANKLGFGYGYFYLCLCPKNGK